MKTKFKFSGQELCVCQYSFFGLIHQKDEDKQVNLTDVEYIERVPLEGLWRTRCGVEFVTNRGESLYVPNMSSQDADSLIAQALSCGAKQLEHRFMFVPPKKILKKQYKGYCLVCDEGTRIARKIYSKKGCNRETVQQDQLKYLDTVSPKYQWVDSRLGKLIISTLGWSARTVKKIDDKKEKFYAVELTEAPAAGQYSKNSLYIPFLSEDESSNLAKTIKNMACTDILERKLKFETSEKSMYKISKGYTVVMDEFDYIVKKIYGLLECETQRVSLDNIMYIDDIKEKRIKGLAFGKLTGGGEANSIEVYGLSKEDTKTLTDMVLKRNANLKPKDSIQYKSVLPIKAPKRWIRKRERLYLTDIGLVHKQYHVKIGDKYHKTRTSIVTYDKIKSYDHNGFLFKTLTILGNTSITTVESYPFWVKMKIWGRFKKLGIKNNLGKKYRASLRHRRGNTVLSVGMENVVAKQGKTTEVLAYANIYECEFKKKHFFSLFGDLSVRGRRTDARAGEGSDVHMKVTHMIWFRGKRAKNHIHSNIEVD